MCFNINIRVFHVIILIPLPLRQAEAEDFDLRRFSASPFNRKTQEVSRLTDDLQPAVCRD